MPYAPRDQQPPRGPRALDPLVGRVELLERVLAQVLDDLAALAEDHEALVEALTAEEEPESEEDLYHDAEGRNRVLEAGPDDLYYGTGDPGEDDGVVLEPPEVEEYSETPAEEAARLRREAEEANQTDA